MVRSDATPGGATVAGVGGFTLFEFVLVLVICLLLAGFAVPNFMNASYKIRLKSSASDLSALMQEARILAAKQNASYAILYCMIGGQQQAYIDLNGNGQWDPGEPVMTFSLGVKGAAGAPSGVGGQPTTYA